MSQEPFYFVAEVCDPITFEGLHHFWTGYTEPGWRAVTSPDLAAAQKYYTRESCENDIKKIFNTKVGVWRAIKYIQ